MSAFQFVWLYWRAVPIRMTGVILGLALSVVLEVQIPDRAADLTAAVSGDGTVPVTRAVWLLLLSFLALSVVQQAYSRVYISFTADVMRRMVNDGFGRVQRLGTEWHTSNFAGATVRKITRGMWAYDTFADMLLTNLGPGLVLLGAFSVAMGLRHPMLGLYFGASIFLFLAVSVGLSLAYISPTNRLANESDTEMGAALADAITCNPVVKGFGAEAREDGRLGEVTRRWRDRSSRSWRRSMNSGAIQSMLMVGLLGGLMAIVLSPGLGPAQATEEVVYVLTSYFIMNGYLRNVGWQVRELQKSVNDIDDLISISKTQPQVADGPQAPELARGPGELRFEGVDFRYPNQPRPVFSGLSVTIRPGEKVALVGQSGAGKTTFVKLLQRLHDVTGGRVVVDGQDIRSVTQSSLRQALAIVPQDPILFHRSLAENIAYGAPTASQAEIEAAAKKAHAHDFISRLPLGYETLVGERGVRLSGGERQRVAIARAILADAPFLILDEATSSLDSETEHHIQAAVDEVMKGRTAVLIAHRLSTVRKADRILVFEAGEIVEEGTHAVLMAKAGGVYRRLHEVQALGFVDEENPSPVSPPPVELTH